jgi:hypothetical protein
MEAERDCGLRGSEGGGEVSVGGSGTAGPEVFEVIEAGREGGEDRRGGSEGVSQGCGEGFRGGFPAQIDDELSGMDGVLELEGKLGNEIVADEIDDGDVAEALAGAEGHFEVGNFGSLVLELGLGLEGEGFEKGVGVEVGGALKGNGGVEPSKEGFAFGIEVVVHGHGVPVGRRSVEEVVKPFLEALSGACGDGEDCGVGVFATEGGLKQFELFLRKCFAFGDDEHIGLFELFSVDVEDLGREGRAGLEAEHTEGADGIEEDGEGGDFEGVAVDASQGVGDGGDEVGAAADGFGDEDFRARGGGETIGGFHEGVEAAAEATARDFLGGEAFRAEHGGIDEFLALVIGDETDALAAGGEALGEEGDGRGFSRSEESSDHEVTSLLSWEWV